MSIQQIEQDIQEAYARLLDVVAVVKYCHEHYLDGLGAPHKERVEASRDRFTRLRADDDARHPVEVTVASEARLRAANELTDTIGALTSAHPWGLAGFDAQAWDAYQPDTQAPPPAGVRVGVLRFDGVTRLTAVPAVASFVGQGHLLIDSKDGQGAARLLQVLALRLATASKPRTMRFALADTVGQGQHLSAFLRLPVSLRVGSTVATSAAEVESLLKVLTDHVLEVTQTRLTNVYDSVEAYNAATTGMQVAYQVLVLAGLPPGLSERGAEMLTQLARNGPRAGVYIVAWVDPRQEMPRGFDLTNLGAYSTFLRLGSDGALRWDDPDFARWSVEPDEMPSASRVNSWLDAVARMADAESTDLPFAQIAIRPDDRWTGDSTDGLDVQIGSNSKGEPQHFVMGSSGVHNGLVGGDVRMGKTNLLHVLISQLALRYSPEELELYLLDFKEVEFDAYLAHRLPHARAITSRTDREFGLSMLRRFHDEIDRRAQLCKEASKVPGAPPITNLPEYRRETGEVMPRALVIMDEFQVLFGEEDRMAERLAREAGRLLADISKRGAAFGLHVLLSTQSPGGSLTVHLKPVYEQMALRIALACTLPSVSQAILGEGNDSATKLSKPGDAIYNDRRGEGVNPMIRIARLTGRDRLDSIASIRELGAGRAYEPPATFDPDASADFSSNPSCASYVANPGQWPKPRPTIGAWLGEAVEIKPATTAIFERYIRSNLLVVGGAEHGYGLLLATVLSAAVQRSPVDVSFTIAEFAKPSSAFSGFFAPALNMPHNLQIVGPRTVGDALNALITDLDDRLVHTDPSAIPARFFVIAGLGSWRELLSEDRLGKPSETAEQLIRLADKGPEVGIHLVAWADSNATAERALRRAGVGHFGLRAVLRVLSPAESDSLLGVPTAANLDDHRGLYRDIEWPPEQLEKFKPYSNESIAAFADKAFRDMS